MSFNPYASESFNRIGVKAEKEAAEKMIDHPLMEGKKIDMTK